MKRLMFHQWLADMTPLTFLRALRAAVREMESAN